MDHVSIGALRLSASYSGIFSAFAKAQAEMNPASKDKTAKAGTFSYAYADLAAVNEAVLGPLNRHGLAVVSAPAGLGPDGRVTVTTLLIHTSGEWMALDVSLKPLDEHPQKIGAVITFARRYGLQSLCGLAAEDPDANDTGTVHPAAKANARAYEEHQKRNAAAANPAASFDSIAAKALQGKKAWASEFEGLIFELSELAGAQAATEAKQAALAAAGMTADGNATDGQGSPERAKQALYAVYAALQRSKASGAKAEGVA